MRLFKEHGFALGLILVAVFCLGISQAKAQTLEFCKNNAAAPECTETPAYETEDYMFGFDKYINRKQQPLKDDIAALQQQVTALQAALANTATTTQVNNLQQQITQLQQQVTTLMSRQGAVAWWTNGDNSNLTLTSSSFSLTMVLQFAVARPNANYAVVVGHEESVHCRIQKFTTSVSFGPCNNGNNAHAAVKDVAVFDNP